MVKSPRWLARPSTIKRGSHSGHTGTIVGIAPKSVLCVSSVGRRGHFPPVEKLRRFVQGTRPAPIASACGAKLSQRPIRESEQTIVAWNCFLYYKTSFLQNKTACQGKFDHSWKQSYFRRCSVKQQIKVCHLIVIHHFAWFVNGFSNWNQLW